jgi:hypothetical protein
VRQGRDFTAIFEVGWANFRSKSTGEKEAHCDAGRLVSALATGTGEAARPCENLSGSPTLRTPQPSQAPILPRSNLFERALPGAQRRDAVLPKLIDWRSYNRQMTDRHFGAFKHQPSCECLQAEHM